MSKAELLACMEVVQQYLDEIESRHLGGEDSGATLILSADHLKERLDWELESREAARDAGLWAIGQHLKKRDQEYARGRSQARKKAAINWRVGRKAERLMAADDSLSVEDALEQVAICMNPDNPPDVHDSLMKRWAHYKKLVKARQRLKYLEKLAEEKRS